jgi:hypothetical protein
LDLRVRRVRGLVVADVLVDLAAMIGLLYDFLIFALLMGGQVLKTA